MRKLVHFCVKPRGPRKLRRPLSSLFSSLSPSSSPRLGCFPNCYPGFTPVTLFFSTFTALLSSPMFTHYIACFVYSSDIGGRRLYLESFTNQIRHLQVTVQLAFSSSTPPKLLWVFRSFTQVCYFSFVCRSEPSSLSASSHFQVS
jgi:hypothetical protein